MDNNFDNSPKDNDAFQKPQSSGDPVAKDSYTDSNADQRGTDVNLSRQSVSDSESKNQYTDPNAGQQTNYQQYQQASQNAYNYNQQKNGYNYNHQSQNNGYNYNQNYNYQDNYSYNTGNNNQNYEQGDTSPMSMGDWILTLLASMIPCVGIVLYFVWAFSKTTNVNRRNFCRAQLCIMGVVLVIYIIFIALFGSIIFQNSLYR